MNDRGLVDAYHDHCYGRLVQGSYRLLTRRSTRRLVTGVLRRSLTIGVAVATLCTVAIVAQPPAVASATATHKLKPPPNTIHHTRIIGHIEPATKPPTCGPVTPPSPAITTLAYLAESSSNEVQAVDESTGALVGTPITVGTTPKGVGYWRPPTSSHFDPEVVVANSGNHSVTLIDAVSSTIIATVSVPAGSSASAVATSPTNDFALVVDPQSGKVSVINLNTNADQGEITLTSTTNVLTGIAFSPSGQYAYVTDPSQHKIFVIQHTVGTSPYYAYDTTYTNASYDFSGVASDLSTTSSGSFYVTDAQASGYLLKFTVAGTLSAPTQVAHFNSPSTTPGAVSVSPASTDAWVAMTGTYKVDDVALPGGAISADTVNSSFSGVGPIGLSADGATLLAADTGSGAVQELDTASGSATNSTAADSTVSAIAPALAQPGSWDAYVTAGSDVDVVNTSTLSLTQTIADADGPIAVVASPDGKYVYVANQTTPSISIIQTSLVGTTPNPIIATFSIPQGSEPNAPIPDSIAINPQGTELLVGDGINGAVDVIDMNPSDSQYKSVVQRIGLLGSGISSAATPAGIAVGPQGTFAYVTEGSSTPSTDGVAVLQFTGSSTTGYTLLANNEALNQGTKTLYAPQQITINPNGESAYVEGFYASGQPNVVYTFPIGTSGELSNGSGSAVSIGYNAAGLTFSPEDQSTFATSTTSYEYSAISIPYHNVTYDSATDDSGPGAIAVSPDGLYVAVGETAICGHGNDGVALYDAGTGTELGSPVPLTSSPQSIAFAPQSSPQTVSTSELVGGASNPAESAVASGMNDVVSSGTPSDAPGASAGVDTATGAYSFSLASMTIPDIGIDLNQSATYDSSRTSSVGLLGHGWTSTYEMTASQNSHSASTNPCAIIVTQEDGATVTFYPSTEGPFTTCPASGYEASGWAQATMTFQASCNGTDACYVMTRGAMTKYYVDESTGQLVKIKDLNGNTVTITWGSHTACSGATSTEPCQVTAADGIRTLTYSYPSAGTGTCPPGSYTCVVVTDPLGRTLTYVKNGSSQLTSVALSNGAQTATYAFTYNSSNQLTNWWDPNNEAVHTGSTTYATDVTWVSSKATEVTGPQMTDAGISMTATYVPRTNFTYTGFDDGTGNGTVLISNPNFNQSSSMYGANLTLDIYSSLQLDSTIQGYGSLGSYGSYLLPPTPSESAIPIRDAYNLMPEESMNALAGGQVGPGPTPSNPNNEGSEYDAGVAMSTYDASGNVLTSVDERGNTTTAQYDSLNQPTISIDAIGNTAGESSSVVAAHTTTKKYNPQGQLMTTTSPATEDWSSNSTTSNYYNSNGTMCASRTADEVAAYGALGSCASTYATTYSYDASGDQSAITDPLSEVSASVSGADGTVCASLSADGYANGERLTVCPTSGQSDENEVLSLNLYLEPTKEVSPSNAAGGITWSYFNLNNDELATVSSLGDPSICSPLSIASCAYTSYKTYDSEGHIVSTTDPTSDPWRSVSVPGSEGPLTTSFFDPDGTQIAGVSRDGNASGSPATAEQASVTTNLGDSAAITLASNVGSGSCSVVSNTSPCPNTAVEVHNALDQSTETVTPTGGEPGSSPLVATATYDPNGTPSNSVIVNTGGGSTTNANTYDANGNTLESTSTSSSSTSGTTTTYEPNGSQCWSSPTAWGGSGAPSCDAPPTAAGSVTTVNYYDAGGNTVAVSGPGSDPYALGNPTGCDPLTTSSCPYTTYYSFDENGRNVAVIEPPDASGNYPLTTYYYDASGQPVATTGPAGTPATCNPVVTPTCSDTSYRTLDADGRLLQLASTDGTPTATWTYNNDGTRHQMVDGTGTTTYTYDYLSRLVGVTNGAGNEVTYGYNSAGQTICQSYPNGASNTCTSTGAGTGSPPSGDVTYGYDAQGRPASIVTWAGITMTIAYDCGGNAVWMSTGTSSGAACTPASPSPLPIPSTSTAVTMQFGYSNGQETSMATSTNAGTQNLLQLGLTRNGDGNVFTSIPTIGSGPAMGTESYTYDDASRVSSGPITGSSGSDVYGYTDSGGITSDTTAFTSAGYSESGELCWTSSASGSGCTTPPTTHASYAYDPSGDLVSLSGGGGPSEAFGWNQSSSQLTCVNTSGTSCSASSPTSSTTVYSYDGDGLRASSTYGTSGPTTLSVWDTANSRLLVSGSTDYIYLPSSAVPVLQITADGPTPVVDLLCDDASSNVRGIVQLAGGTPSYDATVVAYTDYDAFGNPITQAGGSANPGGLSVESGGYLYSTSIFGFGMGTVDATSLTYLRHRYLESSTGQFISRDSLSNLDGQPYAYAYDNPVSTVDPSGVSPNGGVGPGNGCDLCEPLGAESPKFPYGAPIHDSCGDNSCYFGINEELAMAQEVQLTLIGLWSYNHILGIADTKDAFSELTMAHRAGFGPMSQFFGNFLKSRVVFPWTGEEVGCHWIGRLPVNLCVGDQEDSSRANGAVPSRNYDVDDPSLNTDTNANLDPIKICPNEKVPRNCTFENTDGGQMTMALAVFWVSNETSNDSQFAFYDVIAASVQYSGGGW